MVIAFAWPRGAHAADPPLAIKEAALTRYVFGDQASVANAAIACRAQVGGCVPGASYLTFVPPVAVPAAAGCASGTTALMTCYAGAIERTQQALAQGSAAILYEAAERMRVVALRADNSATAPVWMRTASPANLLFRFFSQQGIPMNAALPCTSGTDAARYQCMGKPSGPGPATHRAAIDLLDHFNDVRVNAKQLTGARTRLEAILRSATAPTVAAMTTANKFDPRLGPGLPRMDLLGKISYLRRLTGEASSYDVEKAYLKGLVAYQVSATSPRVGAELALFGAARAARLTVETSFEPALINPAIDADLDALLRYAETAVQLELVRGAVPSAYHAADVVAHYATARSARPFDTLDPERFDRPLTEMTVLVLGWRDGYLHCDWFTVEDITISLTAYYPRTTTKRVWVDCVAPFGEECEGEWITITETEWVAGSTSTIKIGEDVIAESIRWNYKRLLDSDDGDFVDVDDADTAADLDIEDQGTVTNATIARAGIDATNCLAELATISGGYQHALGAASLDCEADPDCQDDYGSGGQLFLPYAMAARLCPMYTKNAVGIDAVTLVDGEVRGVSNWCTTPLEYVATVANTLEHADSKYLEALDDLDGELGKLLAYFAAEANLLTAPVAGVLRQRADLAYFSHEPLGNCDDNVTGKCVGLDVWGERLAHAEDAVQKGLALFRQFSDIHRGEVGLDGHDAIAEFSADGVGVCEGCTTCTNCQANSENQIHALAYRRLRDAIGVYESIRNDQVELAWRKLDAMPASCVAPVDTNGDGALDTNACIETEPGCVAFCPDYAAVRTLATTTRDEMALLIDDLEEQAGGVVSEPSLAALVDDMTTWAAGIADGVDADLQAIDAGLDWLGDRKGRWAVALSASGSTLTMEIEAELARLEVDAEEFGTDYALWIDSYLAKQAVESSFALGAQEAALQTQANIGAYCQNNAGTPAPEGCGLGVALTETNPTANRINDIIENKFCKVAVAQHGEIAVDIANPNSPFYLDPTDDYLDWIVLAGLPACPRLATPDVGALVGSYGGSLIETNILGIERSLLDLEAAIVDFNEYVELMQDADVLFDSYQNAVTSYYKKQATKEWLTDSLVCGAALIGATAATIGSYGAGAATFIGAGTTCAQRFANGSEKLFPNDGNYTAEELGFEASYISQQVQQAEQLYSATMKLETVMLRLADYRAQVIIYQSQLAAFRRTVAYGNTSLDALGSYQPFMDPVYLAIEEQELATMRARFRLFAHDIQSARRTIEYDISNIVPVGAIYPRRADELYWMPRVADITVAAHAGGGAAHTTLLTTGAPPPAEDQTLTAAASLLTRIYADFRIAHGERYDYGEIAYIGSDAPGFRDLNGDGIQDFVEGVDANGKPTSELLFDNPGERAMLGDSRFYDPSERTASGCRKGFVDVSDYCHTFANTSDVVPAAGNCADIRAMPLGERLSNAHLDHMVRPVGVETFVCGYTDNGDGTASYTIAARPGSGPTGGFTGGPNSDLPYTAPTGPWYRGATNTIDEAYYAAQTPVVRALIDHYIDSVLDPRFALTANFKFYPGSFVYGVDMTDPWAEPEADFLSGAVTASQSQSEQLDAAVVICTSATACGADSLATEDSKQVDLVLFGPGHKGSRCRYSSDAVTRLDGSVSTFFEQSHLTYFDNTSRQAQLEFLMDSDLSAGNVQTFKTTAPESNALIEDALNNATLMQRPLHVSRMMVGIYALYDANGVADNASPWAFHVGGGVDPRLRIAVRYSHYNTDTADSPEAVDFTNFLACPVDSEPM